MCFVLIATQRTNDRSVHGSASGDANGTDENPVLNVANGFAKLRSLRSL